MSNFFEKVVGDLGEKRRWRESQARLAQLPEEYRVAAKAVERYFTYFGGISRGDMLVDMSEDLAALFEEAAADGTSIRALLGDDPVEFAETFIANYADGQWIKKERDRLTRAIDAIAPRGDGS